MGFAQHLMCQLPKYTQTPNSTIQMHQNEQDREEKAKTRVCLHKVAGGEAQD